MVKIMGKTLVWPLIYEPDQAIKRVPMAKDSWCDTCDDLEQHYGGKCIVCYPNYQIRCRQCGINKPRDEYSGAYGGKYCLPCLKKRQLMDKRRFFLTVKGYVQSMYAQIRSRCNRTTGLKGYKGLKYMEREEFYKFGLNDRNLPNLVRAYIDSGYEMRLAPSINRIDPKFGYITGNIEIIPMGENARLGAISIHKKKA